MEQSGGLLYFWFPTILPGSIPFDHISPAILELNNQGPQAPLQKLVAASLAQSRDRDVLEFVESFVIELEDWRKLVGYYEETRDPWGAACMWINKNPETWSPWIRFPQRGEMSILDYCVDGSVDSPCPSGCVVSFFIQLVLGLLMSIGPSCTPCCRRSPPPNMRKRIEKALGEAMDAIGSPVSKPSHSDVASRVAAPVLRGLYDFPSRDST